MKFRYRGNTPLSMTLMSGVGLHVIPKQQNVYISEQDWFLTKRLQRKDTRSLFLPYGDDDIMPSQNKKKIVTKESVIQDKPKINVNIPDEVVDSGYTSADPMRGQITQVPFKKGSSVMAGSGAIKAGKRKATKQDKQKKISKKNTKVDKDYNVTGPQLNSDGKPF